VEIVSTTTPTARLTQLMMTVVVAEVVFPSPHFLEVVVEQVLLHLVLFLHRTRIRLQSAEEIMEVKSFSTKVVMATIFWLQTSLLTF
jgi:hypothetical protein